MLPVADERAIEPADDLPGRFLAVPNQGERHSPIHDPESVNHYRHMTAYHFARPFARERHVLDYGCGAGYGTNFLFRTARPASILGLDVSPQAVAYCRASYPDLGSSFVLALPGRPVLPERSFDLVLLFQVIEHLPDAGAILRAVGNVLSPTGRLLMTTPNAALSGGDGPPVSAFHVREYTPSALRALCREHFGVVDEMGVRGSLRTGGRGFGVERLLPFRVARRAARSLFPPLYAPPPSLSDFAVSRRGISTALDLLFACSQPRR